jgi:hypothetical protein
MSNPFDDLESDDAAEADADGSESTERESITEDDSAREAPAVDSPSEPAAAVASETKPPSPAESGPAFEYSSVRQRPLYARGETWDAFERTLRTTIGPALAEADVLDDETREIHDAVLRLAVSEPERVADLVLDARREGD